jgi:hypothetical protein
MIRNVHRQISEERGVDTRFPSTANLMIDSTDRPVFSSSNNFTITPGQQLISGHFTRMAVQEVVMSWGIPNIHAEVGNNRFNVNSPVALDTYYLDLSGNVYEGSTPISNYYDTVEMVGATGTRNPLILVNGIPTPVIPAELPLLDPEGAPIDISGAPLVGEVLAITFRNNFYTVASMVDSIALTLTLLSLNSTVKFTVSGDPLLNCIVYSTFTSGGAAATISVISSVLAGALGVNTYANTTQFYFLSPDIMNWNYIDILCDQLTYCQDVKDSTTSKIQKDVVHRWNFGWSAPPFIDKYGFPILQGYQPFLERRNIGFPKQIKWDPIQTVANLKFESLVSDGFSDLTRYSGITTYIPVPVLKPEATVGSGYEFQMVLLLSEV